jgi:arsenical pump membrane protein
MRRRNRLGPVILLAGAALSIAAASLDPDAARRSADQDWPAFVLVAGLLLIGVVASRAGLFQIAGSRLARLPGSDTVRFIAAMALVAAVSAVLNLDTAAAFVTPVLVHMAREQRRGSGGTGGTAPLVYGSLLVCNAGSLLLPGSNLTNIIVAGQLHLVGAEFFWHMAPAWLVALAITVLVVGLAHRRGLSRRPARDDPEPMAPTPTATTTSTAPASHRGVAGMLRIATVAVVAAALAIVVLRNAAVPVVVIGILAAAIAIWRYRLRGSEVLGSVQPAVLLGLFGAAVALGTVGRATDLPARLLEHAGSFTTAGIGALASIVVNNLPAASLLAARIPPHPYPLLVGLDIGPNLFVTGSLSALLWLRSAREAGAEPSLRHSTALGVIAAPLAIVGSVGVLAAGSIH